VSDGEEEKWKKSSPAAHARGDRVDDPRWVAVTANYGEAVGVVESAVTTMTGD
jgi:hypothetical protein